MTRSEHLAWCKTRAMQEFDYYLKAEGMEAAVRNAKASILSDLGKHPDTSESELLARVAAIDVREWSEDQFAAADQIMGSAIAAMESYLTVSVAQQDANLLHVIGEAIRTLREARRVIVRGLSPDQTKWPNQTEIERLADERAHLALQHLISDE